MSPLDSTRTQEKYPGTQAPYSSTFEASLLKHFREECILCDFHFGSSEWLVPPGSVNGCRQQCTDWLQELRSGIWSYHNDTREPTEQVFRFWNSKACRTCPTLQKMDWPNPNPKYSTTGDLVTNMYLFIGLFKCVCTLKETEGTFWQKLMQFCYRAEMM